MLDTRYLVVYFIHNGQNDGWDYRIVGNYADLGVAKKNYHAKLAEFEGGATYDNVAVMLLDSYGNKLESEWWTSIEPEPAITIVSITKEGNVYTITYSDGRVETFEEPEATEE